MASSFVSRVGHLFEPVANDWLVFYRIAFGLVMLFYCLKGLIYGMVRYFYVVPAYHFPYPGFEWVQLLDFSVTVGGSTFPAVYFQYTAMSVCALLIAVGWHFRTAATIFAVCFVHLFLVDKCYYQNHYYLVSILSVLLPFLPANRAFSIDALRNPGLRSCVAPRWALWLIRFQIGVPYFYGGIAKISADWLRGQPIRAVLPDKADNPIIGGPWFNEEWCVQVFVWGGLFLDLLIVPALLYKPTRRFAFIACLGFHLTNSLVWTIGIFPWLMMAATTVFFEPNWPRQLISWLKRQELGSPDSTLGWQPPRQTIKFVTAGVLVAFVSWQAVFPLRHLWRDGDPHWDEVDHYFSWHMLLRAKETGLRVYITDTDTGRTGTADLRLYLTSRQLPVVARDPTLIHTLCGYVHDDLEAKGYPNTEVRALALVSLNGRRPQPIVDPALDLAALPPESGVPSWLIPLYEPFRHDAWEYPLSEWEDRLDLELPPQMRVAKSSGRNSGDRTSPTSLTRVGDGEQRSPKVPADEMTLN